jgi:hypothetical protein
MRRVAPIAPLVAALLIAGCGDRPTPDDQVGPPPAPTAAKLVDAAAIVGGAHVPSLDPATLHEAEIERVIGAGPRCVFRYTSGGKPVLAIPPSPSARAAAVIKLNGDLVALQRTGRRAFASGPVILTLSDLAETDGRRDRLRPATLVFRVGEELRVGYGGYYSCPGGG